MWTNFILITFSLGFLSIVAASSPTVAEIVFPQLFGARDELGTRVLKVNDKITLNLKKSSVAHHEFFLVTYREGVPLRKYLDVDKMEDGLFHDEKHFASVFVTEVDGHVKVEGVVSPRLKIKPLQGIERANEGYVPHALESISEDQPKIHGVEIPQNMSTAEERSGYQNRYYVQKVHAEVRLVCDYDFYSRFKLVKDLIRYMLIQWNAIRLRYLTVSQPEVHLKLRVIELLAVAKECQYYDYLEDESTIDGVQTLYNLVDYIAAYGKSYDPYDLVYFTTGCDIARVSGTKKEYNYKGFGFVAAVCGKRRVSIGEDTPYSYDGIRTAAHEIAHNLGCAHDGDQEWGQLTHYYANSSWCPWSDGYLMSYVTDNTNSMKFSRCCDRSMSEVAWSNEISCLHNQRTGSRLKPYKTKTLPGYYLSRNEQCRMTYRRDPATHYKKRSQRNCKVECCVMWQGSLHCWPIFLLDGSRCERHKVCINGDCVPKRRRYPIKIVGK